jgi:hypothetical protein
VTGFAEHKYINQKKVQSIKTEFGNYAFSKLGSGAQVSKYVD